jgi:hypothetical protein
MLRQFTAGLLANAAFLAPLPISAQEDGGADDLGVMSISLKDVVADNRDQRCEYELVEPC